MSSGEAHGRKPHGNIGQYTNTNTNTITQTFCHQARHMWGEPHGNPTHCNWYIGEMQCNVMQNKVTGETKLSAMQDNEMHCYIMQWVTPWNWKWLVPLL